MPGKKSRVPEEQRLGKHLPVGVREQPVKKQEVSSSKQQRAMGCSTSSRSKLFHTALAGEQTCQQTGEEQKSSPPVQKERLSQTTASKKARG